MLKQELKKISAFYVEKEEELQAIMQGLTTKPPAALISFHSEVQDLKKYVVLNYVAVIKAIKKRNRHLKVCVCATLQTASVHWANPPLRHRRHANQTPPPSCAQ